MKTNRRQLAKLLLMVPFGAGRAMEPKSAVERQLRPGYILVDGWILKKSDLPDLVK